MDLFPPPSLKEVTTLASTSGSTGEPFYFPRGEEQDAQYEYVAELFLKNQFEIDKYSTLAINGFGMGIWIGGIFTFKILNNLSQKGYDLTIAPTGRMKDVFLKTFKKMASYYDQVILMGYPPFIKDIVDEAEAYGIDWKKHRLKLFFATEGFSEKFRDYLTERSGIQNSLLHSLNIYGSVEFGTMSHETPLSILIRKIALSDKKIFRTLFPNANTTPTLVQYHPHIVYFEEVDGEVVASGYGSSIPLVRYRFHDNGGVYGFEQMVSKLNGLGVDIFAEAKKEGIQDTIFYLPFVFVHGRSDFVVNLRGANIYPENIRKALEHKELENALTGKFVMTTPEDKDFNEYLQVHVELKKNVSSSKKLEQLIKRTIVTTLNADSSEFADMYSSESDKIGPEIVLHDNEDKDYFPQDSIKQRWIK